MKNIFVCREPIAFNKDCTSPEKGEKDVLLFVDIALHPYTVILRMGKNPITQFSALRTVDVVWWTIMYFCVFC